MMYTADQLIADKLGDADWRAHAGKSHSRLVNSATWGLVIGRAFGMVGAQDNDSATVRTTFFIDPAGVIRAMTCYPASLGRSVPEMLRILDGLQAIDAKGALAPANWHPGEPMLAAPSHNLDEVYAAPDIAGWFLRESGGKA